MYTSETSKHRDILAPFCVGYGIDIGFGGDPITPGAIRVDLPHPYAQTGTAPVQLGGDCRHLFWFNNNVLDFVYSSHVLEDFEEGETATVLREWARVLKPGGKLVLLVPDQQLYLRHCRAHGQPINPHHSIDHFSLEYVTRTAERLATLRTLVTHPSLGEYSFAVVFQKIASDNVPETLAETIQEQLENSYRRRDELKALLNETKQRLARLEANPAVRLLRRVKRALRR